MRRWFETAAVAGLFALAAAPFVALFPDPPAFGPAGAGILAGTAMLAMIGASFRAELRRRQGMLTAAMILLGITVAATVLNAMLASTTMRLPTADLLVRLFGLEGEEVDDAVLYERWVELWLACALVAAMLTAGLRRTMRTQPQSKRLASPWDAMRPPTPPRRWTAATVLLWLIGCGVLAGALVEGHRTADFLRRADHTTGTIADPQDHPRIRFTTAEGTEVEFTQNGDISRVLGVAVPVAYLAADPAGTARADTFWANWSDVLGLLWIGGGFTLFPFYGLRAAFRAGRW